MNFPSQKNGLLRPSCSVWGVQRYALNLELPKFNLFFLLNPFYNKNKKNKCYFLRGAKINSLAANANNVKKYYHKSL